MFQKVDLARSGRDEKINIEHKFDLLSEFVIEKITRELLI